MVVDTFRIVVGAGEAPTRVDKLVASRQSTVSRATVQRWIAEGRVTVDGAPCGASDRVHAGQVVDVRPGPRPATEVLPDPTVHFDVLFEDAHLIVVDKPPGVVVHPARGHREGTLVAGLLARPGFERGPSDPRDPEGQLRPGIVHRIDKGTSGLIVVAKDEATREGLKSQLGAHTVERSYRALTIGVPRVARIETLHARDPRSRLKFTSRVSQGRKAVTHVRDVEPLAGGLAASVVCRLETGRTHQIRVHLSECAKTPILGDALYGGVPRFGPLASVALALGHAALHAEILGFVHPITGVKHRFEAPVPGAFVAARDVLRQLR